MSSSRYSLPRGSPNNTTTAAGVRPTSNATASVFPQPPPPSSSPPPYSASYAEGITHCDTTVQSFHKLLLDTSDLRGHAQEYYGAQEKALSKHLACLEKLHQNILEEKRAVESQHQECIAQMEQFDRRQEVVAEESDELVDFLTVDMAHMEEDEESLDARHTAVDERYKDMQNLMKEIDTRLSEIAAKARQLQRESDQLAEDNTRVNQRREMLKRAAVNNEQKEKELKRKESEIEVYIRSLETRESETARIQAQLVHALQTVEREEHVLGVDAGSHHKRSNPTAPVLTLRALMDNHDMNIEREADHEELDIDVGSDYDDSD